MLSGFEFRAIEYMFVRNPSAGSKQMRYSHNKSRLYDFKLKCRKHVSRIIKLIMLCKPKRARMR